MGFQVLIADRLPGEPGGPGQRRAVPRRPTRAQRRATVPPVVMDRLTREDGETLESLLAPSRVLGYPALMAWRRFGPDLYYRGDDLDHLVAQVAAFGATIRMAAEEAEVLGRLLSLARRARDEDLVLLVSPE